jgi:hypothetical protein
MEVDAVSPDNAGHDWLRLVGKKRMWREEAVTSESDP